MIDPAELADSKPKLDPDAGAEILYKKAVLDRSSIAESTDTYYVRVKIYTKQGLDDFAKIDIPYDKETEIGSISARTIKPDGSIVELNSKDIYAREIVKVGNVREKVKSFAPPGLEVGSIIEYTYTESNECPSYFIPIFFQTSLPTRKITYKVKLLSFPDEVAGNFQICALRFNCPNTPLDTDSDGYFNFEMTNLPAAKDEPFQPPAIHSLSSLLIYITEKEAHPQPKQYWANVSKELHKRLETVAKPNKAIRAALGTIVAKDDNELAKLSKIYDYCRTKIINRYSDASGLTAKQRNKLKPNEEASDTLKAGSGTHDDINILFAALVRAAGLDARLVACNDRTSMLFDPAITEADFMLPDLVVAVRSGANWQYFDPGDLYLPFGMLHWSNTATAAVVGDPKGKAEPISIEGPSAEASTQVRKAQFTLDGDGTLEGDVVETFSGYCEVYYKNVLDAKTPAERETYIREDVKEYQKQAEATNVVVENAASPLAQLKISYHLKIPGYADKTGSRLFFQPAVLQKGAPPWFESKTRRTAVLFHYRSCTEDDIKIKIPEGYSLEQASSPGDKDFGALGQYQLSIEVNRKTETITYHRKFTLNGLAFERKYYDPIKEAFEVIQQLDSHTLTLKLNEPTHSTIDAEPATSSPDSSTAGDNKTPTSS